MSRHSHLKILTFLFVCIALACATQEGFARGSHGGSFSGGHSSSFSSSRSSGGSSFHSSSSGWGGSSSSSASMAPSTNSNRSWGASTSSRSSAPASQADSQMATKVNRAGTTMSRGESITTRETTTPQSVPSGAPTQWSTEPTARPTYVPYGTALSGGGYAPVYYDPTYHNYGFWNTVGQWVMWDTILNSNRGNSYYYYNNSPGFSPNQPYQSYGSYNNNNGGYPSQQPMNTYASRGSSGGSFLTVLFGIVVIGGLILVGVFFYFQHSRQVAEHPGYSMVADPVASVFDRSPGPGISSGSMPRSPLHATTSATHTAMRPSNLDEWKQFPPGSFIILSDSQAKEDSQKRGDGFNGIRYAVESYGVADDAEQFGSWVFVNLNDGHQKLLLMIKGVDDAIDYRVYYASEDFRPARREDVVKRGDFWLFQAPANENDYDPADLQYTAEIVQNIGGSEITYVRKEQGERVADYTESPVISGSNDLLATIVEYSTSDAAENPELLVLEIGAAARKTGEVALYLGTAIKESEIDVLKAKA